jgi:hypothetical protein
MIRVDVYDLLMDLPTDRTWKGYKVIGDHIRAVEDRLTKAYEFFKKEPIQNEDKSFNRNYMRAHSDLSEACNIEQESGHGNVPHPYLSFEKHGLKFLPFFLRAMLIQEAAGELRKTIQPSHSYAPQGGTPAQLPFMRATLKLMLAKEWEYERDSVVDVPDTIEGKARDLVVALDGLKTYGKEPDASEYLPELYERVYEAAEAVRDVIDDIMAK